MHKKEGAEFSFGHPYCWALRHKGKISGGKVTWTKELGMSQAHANLTSALLHNHLK